jgi:hypothetical protein
MDIDRDVNALEFLVERVRQLEAQMAFVSMTVAILGQSSPGQDPIGDSARKILERRAAAHDVRKLLDRHAINSPPCGSDNG